MCVSNFETYVPKPATYISKPETEYFCLTKYFFL